MSGHVDSGDGPYVGSPSRDLTWHKHYKPLRPKLKYKCKYIYVNFEIEYKYKYSMESWTSLGENTPCHGAF